MKPMKPILSFAPGERNCTLVQVAFERDGIAAADSTVPGDAASTVPDDAASSMSLDEEACAAALPQ